jgi:parallel beta-helix repeat protein
LGGAGWQFFDDNGSPLSGGKIYTYAAGTSTPTTTYTDSTGTTPNANPIVLDAAGRAAQEIWLTNDTFYKFVLTSSTGTIIWTKDNLPGVFANVTLTAANVAYAPPFTGAVTSNYTVSTKLSQTVSVKDFGAVGNGSTDDTTAIQTCLNYCAASGQMTYFPAGTYVVSSLTAVNGSAGIYCDGTIRGKGVAAVATLVLGSAADPVANASFTLKMDQSGGDLRAVQGYNTRNCVFTNGLFYGFVNSATLNHYAFWMDGPCTGNIWSNNRITLYASPTQRGFGIALYGTVGTGLPYGGFFNGTVSRAQSPAVGNTITGNVILNGSYAVSIQASEYNTVTGNYCYNQNHRTIYFANASWGNTVTGNVLYEFLSSAVLFGYGSSNNEFSGNYCETSAVSGEAAININTGSQGNLISGNKIRAASNYGVYVATDSINTTVIGNDIGQHYLAAIAVENDWESPRPVNAIFSRPNYGAPPAPYSAWSFINLTGVVIKNNVIRAGYGGRSTAAIYVAQITATGNTRTSDMTIDGNSVVSADNIAYNLYIYEETAGYLTDLRITNSDFNAGNTEVSANTLSTSATWLSKISYFANNKQLDVDLVAEEINFADGDTSPSVLQNSGIANALLFVFANTALTSVTTFDDGFENQDITVRLNANTTIVYNAALIRTKGSVNIVGSSTNQLVGFKRIGTVWLETWRNF